MLHSWISPPFCFYKIAFRFGFALFACCSSSLPLSWFIPSLLQCFKKRCQANFIPLLDLLSNRSCNFFLFFLVAIKPTLSSYFCNAHALNLEMFTFSNGWGHYGFPIILNSKYFCILLNLYGSLYFFSSFIFSSLPSWYTIIEFFLELKVQLNFKILSSQISEKFAYSNMF
jgi:hypothetical protein